MSHWTGSPQVHVLTSCSMTRHPEQLWKVWGFVLCNPPRKDRRHSLRAANPCDKSRIHIHVHTQRLLDWKKSSEIEKINLRLIFFQNQSKIQSGKVFGNQSKNQYFFVFFVSKHEFKIQSKIQPKIQSKKQSGTMVFLRYSLHLWLSSHPSLACGSPATTSQLCMWLSSHHTLP